MKNEREAPLAEESTKRFNITIGEALAFIGMIGVAVSVYFTGTNQSSSAVAVLQTDVANGKSAIERLRADYNSLAARLDSRLSEVATSAQTRDNTTSEKIDHIKDEINNIKVLIANGATKSR